VTPSSTLSEKAHYNTKINSEHCNDQSYSKDHMKMIDIENDDVIKGVFEREVNFGKMLHKLSCFEQSNQHPIN
jgi:hypothetical protein